jgi:type II restriction enzyme
MQRSNRIEVKRSKRLQLMNLQCNTELASAYRAGPQIARVLSEEWCSRELYCPACDSSRILQSRTNTPAVDFTCPECRQLFQLKSSRGWNPKKVVDAGYDAMIRAIRTDRTPHLLLLQYTSEWHIQNVLLIPRMFFSESVIEKRKPLGSAARRAGWVGCNILLGAIPEDGKISIVSAGIVASAQRVRGDFDRIRKIAEVPPSQRGWTVDVLNVIRKLRKAEFSLHELYELEFDLKRAHPRNQNVRAKIRQQLQVLRDLGLLDFSGQGNYALRS